MVCRQIEFSATKSEERINRALRVFPKGLLMRLLAFVLHLLGAKRKAVAELVDMPEESSPPVVPSPVRRPGRAHLVVSLEAKLRLVLVPQRDSSFHSE